MALDVTAVGDRSGSGGGGGDRILASNWPTLQAAVAANPNRTIVVNSHIDLGADITDASVVLFFEQNGVVTIAENRLVNTYVNMANGGQWVIPIGITLTFGNRAYPNAPSWLQIFDWDEDDYDSPPVLFDRIQEPIYVRWWGGPFNSGDVTRHIQAAINSVPRADQSQGRSVGRVIINGSGLLSELTHVSPVGGQPNVTGVGLLLDFQELILEGLGTADSGAGPTQTRATLLEWAGSSGTQMIQVRGCSRSIIREFLLRGNTTTPPDVAIALEQPQDASETYKGNRYVRFDTISIGQGGGTHEFVSGIEGTSPGGGDDFHEFFRIEIANCDNGIRNDNGNHTFWNFHNCAINNCTNGYSMGLGSGRTYFYQLHCSQNTWDFNWENSQNQTPRIVYVDGYGSEGSLGMAHLNGWCHLSISHGGFSARGASPSIISGTTQARFQMVILDQFYLSSWAGDPVVGSTQADFPSTVGQKRFFSLIGRLGPSLVVNVDAQSFPISGTNNWINERFEIDSGGVVTQVTEWSL